VCACQCSCVFVYVVCTCLCAFRFVRFVIMSSMSTAGRFVRVGGNYPYMLGLWPPQFQDLHAVGLFVWRKFEHARMYCRTFQPIGQLCPRAQLHWTWTRLLGILLGFIVEEHDSQRHKWRQQNGVSTLSYIKRVILLYSVSRRSGHICLSYTCISARPFLCDVHDLMRCAWFCFLQYLRRRLLCHKCDACVH